jgi:hypothetical protein
MAITQRRRQGAPSKEALDSIHDFAFRQTAGMRPEGGLRIDWTLLSDAETAELYALTREAEGEGGFSQAEGEGGFSLDRLGEKKAAKWERLVGKGAGIPEFFKDYRATAEIKSIAVEALRQSARRPIRRQEEVGLLGVLGQQVVGGYLHAEHVSLATIIFVQLDTGVAFAPRARIERVGDEPVLEIDSGFGIVGGDRDPNGTFATFQPTLRHLEANGWFEVDRSGREWRIRLGWRANRAMAITAKTKKKAA